MQVAHSLAGHGARRRSPKRHRNVLDESRADLVAVAHAAQGELGWVLVWSGGRCVRRVCYVQGVQVCIASIRRSPSRPLLLLFRTFKDQNQAANRAGRV